MNPDEARALLARLLRDIAPEADLTGVDPDALLQDELDLDSMDFLNLVTALHDETGIDVPERDYPQLATVGGFVAYVAAAAATSPT
jgi:acyl carrier protein